MLQAYISQRSLPQNIKEIDFKLFEKEFSREIFSSKKVKIKMAVVMGDTIWDWTSFRFLDHLTHATPLSTRAKIKRATQLFRLGRFVPKAIWICDNWSHNFFHWMTESLPRLIALNGEFKKWPILLPSYLKQFEFVNQSLEFLNFPILYFDPNEKLNIGTLISFEKTAPSFNFHEEIIRKTGNEFIKEKSIRDKKVYISRSKAKKRRITNEPDFIKILEKRGYSIFNFDEISFKEQIETMKTASHLVSIHGAGLTNMLFMAPGSKVLELRFRGDTTNNCFFSLASALKIKYYYSQNDFFNPKIHLNSDMIIDLEASEEALIQMDRDM